MKTIVGVLAVFAVIATAGMAHGQDEKPNILFIVSDDTGYGDLGPYGGGVGRGMPTPSIDRLASEGMTFFSFYAQPSCTPGRGDADRTYPQSQRHDDSRFSGARRRITQGRMDTGVSAEIWRL